MRPEGAQHDQIPPQSVRLLHKVSANMGPKQQSVLPRRKRVQPIYDTRQSVGAAQRGNHGQLSDFEGETLLADRDHRGGRTDALAHHRGDLPKVRIFGLHQTALRAAEGGGRAADRGGKGQRRIPA